MRPYSPAASTPISRRNTPARVPPADIRGHARSCRLSERRAGIIEQSTARRMPGFSIGRDLPAQDRGIDIERIELQAMTDPAGALGGDQRRAAAEKGVEHNLTAAGTIPQCIGYQRHRLDRRMQRKKVAFGARPAERVGSGVAPHIAAVTTIKPELNMVLVRLAAVLEDEHELVLAAVEGTHA